MNPAHLVACSACTRHVRASEPACPFCAATLTSVDLPRPAPAARLSRSALHAFGIGALSVATAVTGCTHEQAVIYGGPPDLGDTGFDAARPVPSASASSAPAPSASAPPAPTPSTPPAPSASAPPSPSGVHARPPAPVYGGPPPHG